MNWQPILDLALMGFTVCAIFIMYREQRIHLRRMHLQNQNTWNAVVAERNKIEGLHDKYAKLYDRVTELEKTNEVHS